MIARMETIKNVFRMLIIAFCFIMFSSQVSHASISSITIDANSGEVLSASNADEARYPASLTKIMTLYITFDALEKGLIKMDSPLKVSRTAANRSPSRLGLTPGETITVRQAVNALIVKSANDCATVLAENLGYSEENFAITMTKVAHELGMKNTTFKNASGLPNRAQKTTARDMALLGAAIYHHFPQYYDLFSIKKFTYKDRTYYTHNRLLKTFVGADGMKTGYTNAAGFNIVTSAKKDGQRVIAVTMGHKTSKARDSQVASMMNKGLTKLAHLDRSKMETQYAKIEPNPDNHVKGEETVANASISYPETTAELVQEIKENWGIQVGAFSNYTKARNYAGLIHEEVSKKYSNINIDIEPVAKEGAVIYRSKIIGLNKNDAQTACNGLKKTNKSCIVVEVKKDNELTLAMTNGISK